MGLNSGNFTKWWLLNRTENSSCRHKTLLTNASSHPSPVFTYLLVIYISHSEYLVINWVQAAYQQNLIVQCVKCVLYKVLSVYCPCVLCLLYKVCRLCFTRCTLCIIQGVQCKFTSKQGINKEDFDIKSDLI